MKTTGPRMKIEDRARRALRALLLEITREIPAKNSDKDTNVVAWL